MILSLVARERSLCFLSSHLAVAAALNHIAQHAELLQQAMVLHSMMKSVCIAVRPAEVAVLMHDEVDGAYLVKVAYTFVSGSSCRPCQGATPRMISHSKLIIIMLPIKSHSKLIENRPAINLA
jgi:hypothetical protein